jgi:uncharacterized coiled-coil DUF342 family protein
LGSRQLADSDATKEEFLKLQELISSVKEILIGLQLNLSLLHQTIRTLESKPELLNNLEIFEKDAEYRASKLEGEVKELREQLEIIKDILGLNTKNPPVEY